MTKSRILWMSATAAIFVAALWAFISVRNSPDGPVPDVGAASQSLEATYRSVAFTGADLSDERLLVSGTSSPGSLVTLYRVLDGQASQVLTSQTSTNDGIWRAEVALGGGRLPRGNFAVEIMAKLPSGTTIRGVETLFAVSLPAARQEALGARNTRAALLALQPGGPSRVLQSPFNGLPRDGALVLEAVDYDNSGGVIFTGSAPQNGLVRISANGALIGETGVDARQRWTLIAGSTLPVGTYDIQVSLMAPDDAAPAQLEFPLERMASGSLQSSIDGAGPLIAADFKEDVWQLRRSLYGGGEQYSIIYSPLVLVP